MVLVVVLVEVVEDIAVEDVFDELVVDCEADEVKLAEEELDEVMEVVEKPELTDDDTEVDGSREEELEVVALVLVELSNVEEKEEWDDDELVMVLFVVPNKAGSDA